MKDIPEQWHDLDKIILFALFVQRSFIFSFLYLFKVNKDEYKTVVVVVVVVHSLHCMSNQ